MSYRRIFETLVALSASSTYVGDVADEGLRTEDDAEGPRPAAKLFAQRLLLAQGGGTGCGGVGLPYPDPSDSLFEQLDEPEDPVRDATNPSPRLPVLAPLRSPDQALADTDSPPMFNLAQPPMRGTTG